ncbi:Detected protein of unknown function [Hibiscus syriacus]|uniref:Uncharacterized protein n=1 Tax=Hibiscus syriacus TaxID=106335 RepID=A0A6A3D7B4_HIBSY|nr:Detected protein of unknown function [Hibiscus syriacus]
MENKKQVSGSSSSSSLDHLFGPKNSSSSSSTGLFGAIFPPPSVVLGRDSTHSGIRGSWNNQGLAHHGRFRSPVLTTIIRLDSEASNGLRNTDMRELSMNLAHFTDHTTDYTEGQSSGTRNKDKSSSIYHDETVEPSYLSSSIYYGGQENYSPRNNTTQSPPSFKLDGGHDDRDGNDSSDGASRGNWWKGSLYY